MTVSVDFSDRDTELLEKYAASKNLSLSELVRQTLLEKIEDESDLQLFDEAMEEYRKDPVTFSQDEVERMLLG